MSSNATADKMRDRVRALLAKTTGNGATEAEALAAAEKARELIDIYNIDLASGVDRLGSGAIIDYAGGIGARDLVSCIAPAIGRFSDTTTWRRDNRIAFCGDRIDVDFACYLFESLRDLRDRELVRWRGSEDGRFAAAQMRGEQVNRAFTLGFVERIRARLDEITNGRKTAAAAAGSRALVVTKQAAIAECMEAAGIRLSAARGRRVVARNDAARNAGQSAGNRASFGRPVSSGGGVLLLK